MKRFLLLAVFFISSTLFSQEPWIYDYNFSKGRQGWVGDFAEYPIGQETFFELDWGWEDLPTEIPSTNAPFTKGLYLSGNNHSDDLFMFVRRQIVGLVPNTFYALTFSVLIESDVPPSQVGIGGSPGESVYIKVGASPEKPEKEIHDGYYLLNVDKGSQSESGKYALVVGNLTNETVDPDDPRYLPKQLSSKTPLIVKTDSKGSLWLFFGTDSGYEGVTKFYIAEIIVKARPV